MLVLFGSNCPKRIRREPEEFYKEIGSRFLKFENKQRLKQQLGAIESRAKKKLNEKLMNPRDFNEVSKLLKKIRKW